jgi:hypothetical protein
MISGNFTPDDLLAAQWVHLRPRRSLAVAGIVLLVVYCVGVAMMFVAPIAPASPWVQWVMLAMLAYFPIVLGVMIPYRTRRSFRQRKDFQRETSYRASESGVSIENENLKGIKPWSDYLKWKEGRKVFLLYLSDNMFQIVPKRFFGTESELAGFRALLEKAVPRGKS